MQSERYPYYAVRKGKSPGIYTTWKECEQQVVGFRNNEYKGFRVLEEAQSWLREGGIMLHEDLPSHGKTRTVYDMDLPRLLIGLPLHQLTSSTMWATDVAVLYVHPRGAYGVDAAKDLRAFAYWESYICPTTTDSKGGGLMFRYTVVLPENSRGLDLVVYGPAYADERTATQEVAFLMLERLLGATGYKIHDYNYRVMVRITLAVQVNRMEGLTESEKKEDANHPTAADPCGDGTGGIPELTAEELIPGEDSLVFVFNKLRRHLMENVSTTRALQASQARTLKTLSDCITSHRKILEILWEEYADWHRKKYPQAGIEPYEADWPGKKEAVVANKGMTTRSQSKQKLGSRRVADSDHPLKRRLDFDSSDDEYGREVLGENPRNVTPLLFEIKKNGLLSSDDMPKFLDVDFRPPKGMKCIATELAVAAYIFARDLEQGEILYSGEHCHGPRHVFWLLRPRQEVVDDVINLVATMLNDERHDPYGGFRPSLNPSTYCKETLAFIRHKYMKYVDETANIYIPLNKDHHWYLMVVDLREKALIYLDFAKYIDAREGRMDQMEYMAFFLLRLLNDRKFYRKKESKCPDRSEFDFREPMTSQQRPNSLDCGVWVTQWMQLSELWTSYDLEIVNDIHRMQLAMDLVMSRANPIRSKICQRAVEYWDNAVRGSARKPQMATKKKTPKASLVISVSTSTLSYVMKIWHSLSYVTGPDDYYELAL
ncbi:hypothetical protein AHAS_Ahas06G0066000 [Arachis hypogaea]